MTRLLLAACVALTALACGEGATDPPVPLQGTLPLSFSLAPAYAFDQLGAQDFITVFDFQSDGALWAASFEGKVLRVEDGVTTLFEPVGADPVAGGVTDLFIDGTDRVWITTKEAYGFFDGDDLTLFDTAEGMAFEHVVGQIAVNGAGEILLASGTAVGGGLIHLKGGVARRLTPDDSDLPSSLVREIAVGPDGDFWVAAAQFQGRGGISRVSGGDVTEVYTREDDGLLLNWIDDLEVVGERVWLGFTALIHDEAGPDGGMQSFVRGGGAQTWYPFESGLTSNRVLSLEAADDGDLWFTTSLDHHPGTCDVCFPGVGRLTPDGWYEILSYMNYDVEPNQYFPCIEQDPQGRIHVATGREILQVVRP